MKKHYNELMKRFKNIYFVFNVYDGDEVFLEASPAPNFLDDNDPNFDELFANAVEEALPKIQLSGESENTFSIEIDGDPITTRAQAQNISNLLKKTFPDWKMCDLSWADTGELVF